MKAVDWYMGLGIGMGLATMADHVGRAAWWGVAVGFAISIALDVVASRRRRRLRLRD